MEGMRDTSSPQERRRRTSSAPGTIPIAPTEFPRARSATEIEDTLGSASRNCRLLPQEEADQRDTPIRRNSHRLYPPESDTGG
jgi:hypothetical protein